MTSSIQCAITQVENCLSGSVDEKQLSNLSSTYKNIEDGSVYSVATIDDLPDATLNTGRMIFVESVGEYRYSDGLEWLNEYSTKPQITLYGWGDNIDGYVGDGTLINRSSPVQEASSSTDWCQVSGNNRHTSALKTSGTLWSWGNNFAGRLGDNSTNNRSSPVQEFSSSTDWCQVASGGEHSLALKTSGTLWGWGYNASFSVGLLGDGTIINRSSPVQEVSSSTDWCQVSGGCLHSLALKTSGTLWGWGFNDEGRLGDGTTICRSSPVQEVSSSTDWCQVSGGNDHSAALKTSGTLWSWGNGSFGPLGNNSPFAASSPVQEASSSTDWCQVSGGNIRSLALKTSGTLWSWGFNYCGALGDNTTVSRLSPVQEVSSSTDWCRVFSGSFNSLAVKTSGTLWSWGSNFCGQLGEGTTISRSSPVQEVSSSSNWCQVSGGNAHSLALKVEKGFV